MGFRETILGLDQLVGPDFHLVKRNTGDVLEQADALPFWSQDYTQLSKGVFFRDREQYQLSWHPNLY